MEITKAIAAPKHTLTEQRLHATRPRRPRRSIGAWLSDALLLQHAQSVHSMLRLEV